MFYVKLGLSKLCLAILGGCLASMQAFQGSKWLMDFQMQVSGIQLSDNLPGQSEL